MFNHQGSENLRINFQNSLCKLEALHQDGWSCNLFRIYINKKNIWIRFVSSHQDINYHPVKLRSILSSDHHQSFSCEVSIQTEKNFQFLQIFFQDSLQIISTKRLQMFRQLFKNCHSLREEIWSDEGTS